MEDWSAGAIAALGGLAGGMVLGFAARWGRFCTLGAIEDASLGGDRSGIAMWGLAIAIAVAGTYGLDQAGLIDLSTSFYVASPVSILATITGGFMFGLGMALVGTCGYGMLARIGGGDLKSVVTFLVMGIAAYATIGGAISYLRVFVFPPVEPAGQTASIAHALERSTGLDAHGWAYLLAGSIALASLADPGLRHDRKKIGVSVLVGLVIVWGWLVTGILAADPFNPQRLESFTFSAPLGDTLIYVMTMSGAALKFGIGATLGVILGAALTSLAQGRFRWEACDDARELRRQILGGVLMGAGGVTALGCTIGQGLSAASLLAFSAPVALGSIFAGAWIGLQYLVDGSFMGSVRIALGRTSHH